MGSALECPYYIGFALPIHKPEPMDPTFEADPIGKRLECLPQERININFTLFLKGIFNGAPGGPGVN